MFKNKFYDQIDGVAMGSPLAPVLANLFMGHHEHIWLSQYENTKPLFYRRYVDDIFAVFKTKNDAILFFNYLNSRHPNLKFTMETEKNNEIAFLDVLIKNSDNNFTTTTFHKSTFTGLLLNYSSFTSRFYKIGLIKCLVDRAYKINNTWSILNTDFENIKKILRRNSYPLHIIEKI